MSISYSVDGLKELEAQLKELELVTQKRVLRQAARASAKPIEKEMRDTAQAKGHVDTGNLIESIKTRTSIPKNQSFADVFATTGVFKNRRSSKATGRMPAPVYAYWLEFGVEPHATGKSANLDRGVNQDNGLMHPGIKAKPFIRPSFDNNTQRSLEIQKTELSKAIDKALERGNR